MKYQIYLWNLSDCNWTRTRNHLVHKRTLNHGAVVQWLSLLHSFKSCSRRVRDSRWWGSLTMVPAGNKTKRLSSVNHTTKTIHHSIHGAFDCMFLSCHICVSEWIHTYSIVWNTVISPEVEYWNFWTKKKHHKNIKLFTKQLNDNTHWKKILKKEKYNFLFSIFLS